MITLTITQDDMEKGIVNSPSSDPIALAAQRAGMRNPLVGLKGISFDQGMHRARIAFGPELQLFVKLLAYRDRHEMLAIKRGKKEGEFHHIPATFVLKMDSVKFYEEALATAA